MPKRVATNQLTHENWNEEDEPEEENTSPQVASPEVLSKRIIKTGKRRLTNSSITSKSAFTNFIGFGSTNSSGNDIKSPFSFLSNSNNSTFSNTNGISDQKAFAGGKNSETEIKSSANDNEYLSKLKVLNESVLEWIKIHVSKNPTCILTPIFNDYEKHLKDLLSEKQSKLQQKEEKTEITTTTITTNISSNKSFFSNSIFSSNNEINKDTSPKTEISTKSSETSQSVIPGLNPIPKNNPVINKTQDNTKSIFTLPVTSSSTLGDKLIKQFGKSPSSFGNSPFSSSFIVSPPTTTTTTTTTTQEEDDNEKEDEPPKNLFERVTEEGAVFSQRVKLFLKKKDNFVDNGVGTLYIKPVDDECTKYQAIVRADTSLGNILLNLILKDTVPSKRVGKNNVMIVCILEVDGKNKPVPALLRVKTENDAENLLEQINKYKKSSN